MIERRSDAHIQRQAWANGPLILQEERYIAIVFLLIDAHIEGLELVGDAVEELQDVIAGNAMWRRVELAPTLHVVQPELEVVVAGNRLRHEPIKRARRLVAVERKRVWRPVDERSRACPLLGDNVIAGWILADRILE